MKQEHINSLPTMCAAANPWGSVSTSASNVGAGTSLADVMSEQLADQLNSKEMSNFQKEINADLVLEDQPAEASSASATEECTDDLLIAQMLQMQFDREYDQQLQREEHHHNGTSKVRDKAISAKIQQK